MKIRLLLFPLLLISVLAEAQQRYDTIRYAREYYRERVALFNSEPVQKGKIIFLGNSITEFGDWQKLLKNSSVVNRGIAGDNTYGVLDRLDDVIERQPSKLFIKIGINDISQNIPESMIVENITAIVDRVHAASPETQIYVQSVLPTNDEVKKEYPDAFGKNAIAESVNSRVNQEAKKHRFTYVDLSRILKDKKGKLDTRYASPDGIHLNEAGYQVWVKLLKSKGYL